ncbi:MAG: ABC transporter permease [Anaerolineaceae bacterium]|nr:MAG: ABC transporter permease [Anaerolineaceae bacterium]
MSADVISLDQTPSRTLLQDVLFRFVRHRVGMVGAVITSLLILAAIFGPSIAPHEPNRMHFTDVYAPPSLEYPFGADDFGRDIFSRVLFGARVSLMVGVVAVSIALVVGTTLGMIAGYGRRFFDEAIMRAMDVLFAFPTILLALAIIAILGRGVSNAMIAIGIVYIPIFARIARGEVLAVKNEEYVEAARSLGAGHGRILLHHVLPNILAPLIVQTALSLSFAILAEATLSFFTLGTQPPDPSWGRMLSEGRGFFRHSIWMGLFPGLAIMFSVMGFNFLGDGLRDALDPRLRNR